MSMQLTPQWEEQYTVENSKVCPIAKNGKTPYRAEFALDAEQSFIEKEVLSNEVILKMAGRVKNSKKFIT